MKDRDMHTWKCSLCDSYFVLEAWDNWISHIPHILQFTAF